MKTTHALTAATAVLLLGLTGCSASTPAEGPATSAPAAAEATPTPSPTPEEMTVEQAGQYYLETTCATNAAGSELTALLADPDATLEQVQAAGAVGVDSVREGAERLSSDEVIWPEAVQDDVDLIFDAYLADAGGYSSIANIESVDAAIALPWPVYPEGAGAAPQRIRFALDLPANTTEGCEAFTQ